MIIDFPDSKVRDWKIYELVIQGSLKKKGFPKHARDSICENAKSFYNENINKCNIEFDGLKIEIPASDNIDQIERSIENALKQIKSSVKNVVSQMFLQMMNEKIGMEIKIWMLENAK